MAEEERQLVAIALLRPLICGSGGAEVGSPWSVLGQRGGGSGAGEPHSPGLGHKLMKVSNLDTPQSQVVGQNDGGKTGLEACVKPSFGNRETEQDISSHNEKTTTWQDPRKSLLQMNQPAPPSSVPVQPQNLMNPASVLTMQLEFAPGATLSLQPCFPREARPQVHKGNMYESACVEAGLLKLWFYVSGHAVHRERTGKFKTEL
ncbi:hypothetical protein CCH79_00012089 [Gambusia affinis]|uniref:Uncharacterized protein n=1 Tax=Gambusia affinis TaxID=33528 RepID=A0A315VZV4_GAMAF|nr:hypothetical protein CCH79_00012089 [Gambusia affinis]